MHPVALAVIGFIWLVMLFPFVMSVGKAPGIIFPPPVSETVNPALFLGISIVFSVYLASCGLSRFFSMQYQGSNLIEKKFLVSLLLIIIISFNGVYGYKYQQGSQTVIQRILVSAYMDEDFDDLPPGTDPPGWDEQDGNWTTVDDNGNIVYFQDDDSDKEALSISTTGNETWENYTYNVDLKFVEGNPNKGDRGALLIFRYQGGNNYYYLWMKEAHDELELYNHGAEGGGNSLASTSCTLVQDVWYHVNITINGQIVDVSIDGMPYFSSLDMNGARDYGSVAVGTRYYRIMFDNILVEPI
jgi:hypothetical protein